MIKWFKRRFRKKEYKGAHMVLAFGEGFSVKTDCPKIVAYEAEGEQRFFPFDDYSLPILMTVKVVGFMDKRAPQRDWT